MRPRPRYSGIHTSMSRLRQGLSTRTLRTESSAMASGQSPRTSGHVTKSPTPPRLAYANEQKNLMTASPVTMKSKRTTKPTIRVLRKKQKTAKKQQTKKNIADRQTAAGYKSFHRPAEYALRRKKLKQRHCNNLHSHCLPRRQIQVHKKTTDS